ncbi:MAG: YdeI/OmpD-associated family protein [Ferruginibacter sp.]|nr:YdeI/OmpD-associated family protein [Bacteroidota bacterium]MBX2918759.1 YdeI/OmpD-associated family protein [Ferruginibacter sp.]MCB0708142.1 YdeI/OmpD-associated family protein [Chitinophagaceae bacterium]
MPAQSLLEKLQLKDEKNLLIQGLPSSIEKQFIKLNFSKGVTPLLKKRKIDFALVFAVNQKQLSAILKEVIPALQEDAKFWIAYPKLTSKISSDLSRDKNWDIVSDYGYETVRMIALDNVWSAGRFKKPGTEPQKTESFNSANPAPGVDYENKTVTVPEAMQHLFKKNKKAGDYFESLAFSHKREYVEWILSAKKEETIQKRLQATIEKLSAGKKNMNEN